MIIYLAYL